MNAMLIPHNQETWEAYCESRIGCYAIYEGEAHYGRTTSSDAVYDQSYACETRICAVALGRYRAALVVPYSEEVVQASYVDEGIIQARLYQACRLRQEYETASSALSGSMLSKLRRDYVRKFELLSALEVPLIVNVD